MSTRNKLCEILYLDSVGARLARRERGGEEGEEERQSLKFEANLCQK